MVDGESGSREAMDGARAAPGAGAWEGASIPGPRFPQSRPVREMLGERFPAPARSWSRPLDDGHPSPVHGSRQRRPLPMSNIQRRENPTSTPTGKRREPSVPEITPSSKMLPQVSGQPYARYLQGSGMMVTG
jgi:hypothetical protein